MISAEMLKKAICSAAKNIEKHSEQVNSLNVFPVPDGDTGTNLSLTLSGCAGAISDYGGNCAGELADIAAGELLRCARGNSGVIFSLIFKGFAQSIDGLDFIDAKALARGLENGCEEAYAALEKPTEGTMLTVIRIAASKAHSAAKKGKSVKETFYAALDGARASLKSTPNLLPILKKHGVVDAGGQGLVYILEGMAQAENADSLSDIPKNSTVKSYKTNDDIKYIYCTEFLINGAENADIALLKKRLSETGDCTAAAEHSGIIKVHIHTNAPDSALALGLELGELSNIKIDNMKFQAAAASEKSRLISLCSGSGLKEFLEKNEGVSALECSGSMNASAGDILKAIAECNCENIFISPNNKNTVLAAKRAAVMSGKRVWVNNAETIPEGIAAAKAFSPSNSPENNIARMDTAVSSVISGAVTYAARDGSFGSGKHFCRGQIIGLVGGEIVCAGYDISETAAEIIRRLLEKSKQKRITLFYGKDTDGGNAEKVVNTVLARCGNIEIEPVYGGQPLYYYLISAE